MHQLICFVLHAGTVQAVLLTVVYWIMTLFSSSGLKSVFFCSVAKICFICPTMQFSVLYAAGKTGGENHLGCNCVSGVPFPKVGGWEGTP